MNPLLKLAVEVLDSFRWRSVSDLELPASTPRASLRAVQAVFDEFDARAVEVASRLRDAAVMLDRPAGAVLLPMELAPKSGVPILARFRGDLPGAMEDFSDRFAVISNRGDRMGWVYAGPVGSGGFRDEQFVGWQHLNVAPHVPEAPEPVPGVVLKYDGQPWLVTVGEEDYLGRRLFTEPHLVTLPERPGAAILKAALERYSAQMKAEPVESPDRADCAAAAQHADACLVAMFGSRAAPAKAKARG